MTMQQTIKGGERIMSPGSQTTSAEPAAHRGIDKFDVMVLILLLATFIGVAILPFSPKKFGDLVFHREGKALALAVRGAGPWDEVRIARAPAPVLYYAIPY